MKAVNIDFIFDEISNIEEISWTIHKIRDNGRGNLNYLQSMLCLEEIYIHRLSFKILNREYVCELCGDEESPIINFKDEFYKKEQRIDSDFKKFLDILIKVGV